ncbi:MAG: DUF6430 domain-containing protein [Nitrospirae bacterium]|nr:DUF6430 domain-containing protein [Nitrospirota bacterium]
MKDLWNGIINHPWKTVRHTFVSFSVLWTLTEGLTYFVPGIQIKGFIALGAIILISLGYALKQVWKPSVIEIKVSNSNTTIEVLFGDLFQQDGIRAIAVNEFFDSQLGKPVSEKSLHGIFLNRCFGGHPEPFDKQVEKQLKGLESMQVERSEGKTKSYSIGSSALITADKDKYLAFAFAKTDPATCKAYSDVTMMWVALHQLWQRARIESGGDPLNVPLVGSGLSGLGLPTRDLLNLIILSAITETKAKQVTQRIRIVLHRDRFEELDLRDVKQHWEI